MPTTKKATKKASAAKSSKQAASALALSDVRPRAPSRGNGVLKYAALVDATEVLLRDKSAHAIGLYQIAEQAGVPPASVYHFFPTKEAAFLALAQRYLEGFWELSYLPVEPSALKSWQTLMAWDFRKAMQYYNANPPALKLFLGGFGGEEIKQADREYNERSARALAKRLGLAFHMPFVRDAEKRFHIVLQIYDSILQISYLRKGRISEDYLEEAVVACTAYCRQFLPENLEPQDAVRAAVSKGRKLVLQNPEKAKEA